MTSKEALAKLFELRKEYSDDPQDATYLALHHACLFLSYQIGGFEQYLRDDAERAAKKAN